MDGWMDGWMDGSMDGWMDGWMDRWVDGWINGSMHGYSWSSPRESTAAVAFVPLWQPFATARGQTEQRPDQVYKR